MNITNNETKIYLAVFAMIGIITLGGFYFSHKDNEVKARAVFECAKCDSVSVRDTVRDAVVIRDTVTVRDTVEITSNAGGAIPQVLNESQTIKNLKETIKQQDRIIRKLQNKK